MSAKLGQSRNACAPIFFTVLGSATEVTLLQLFSAYSGISEIPSSYTTVVKVPPAVLGNVPFANTLPSPTV